MYPLVETIKIKDGAIYNLYYHQKRLQNTYYTLFGEKCPSTLQSILYVPQQFQKGLIKLRFLYGKDIWALEFLPYSPRKIEFLKIVNGDNIEYSHKFTDRSCFFQLLEQKGDSDEILIAKKGLLTDTSFSNIIFFDGEQWFTPASPLLKGVCRQKLLQEKHIVTADIRVKDLKYFTHFALINAILCGKEIFAMEIKNIQTAD